MACALLEDCRARSPSTRGKRGNNGTVEGTVNNNALFSASLGGNLLGSRAWCVNGSLRQGESRSRCGHATAAAAPTAVAPQSPDTRKIRQRIHDARATLRSLRTTTAGASG